MIHPWKQLINDFLNIDLMEELKAFYMLHLLLYQFIYFLINLHVKYLIKTRNPCYFFLLLFLQPFINTQESFLCSFKVKNVKMYLTCSLPLTYWWLISFKYYIWFISHCIWIAKSLQHYLMQKNLSERLNLL